jgi:2-phosphosulfolactate phosphatase
MKTVEVLFTPADFAALPRRDLSATTCVVFDVFRATSSMVTALANGAEAILPVAEIPEALERRRADPSILLAGERNGLRIGANLTGGVDFDLGNSPREFTRQKVAGRTIVMTTTNGTRALRACAGAKRVLIASFLNLQATADRVAAEAPEELRIICAGTFDETALEDVLGAGALCDLLWNAFPADYVSDSAIIARTQYRAAQADLASAAGRSRNGRRLLSNPELRDDVAFCLQRDVHPFAVAMEKNGKAIRLGRVDRQGPNA